MKTPTEVSQTAKLLNLGLVGLLTLFMSTAEAQAQSELRSVGVSMTGPNDRCGEEIWTLSGITPGPDSHGTFLGIEDPTIGINTPFALTPADCAAADPSIILATSYDAAYGAVRGWPDPHERVNNLPLRGVAVPTGSGIRAPIPLPGLLPPNPLPPTISRPTDPITAGNWLAAGGDMQITCDDVAGTGTVSAKFHNLIPNGVYTMWGAWAANGVVLEVPLGGLPNTIVASHTGDADFCREIDFCLLDLAPDGSELQYASLAFHADTVSYGSVPSEPFLEKLFVGFGAPGPFNSTIPGGVVTFDQVGFRVHGVGGPDPGKKGKSLLKQGQCR